jgi:hypothetical protein
MKHLSPEELSQISFMHYMLLFERNNSDWEFHLEDRIAKLNVSGAVLRPDPLTKVDARPITVLGKGTLTVSDWLHFEVFRRNPSILRSYLYIGWATETRRPPNPISCPHFFIYSHPGHVKVSGYGEEPGAMYAYIFENSTVTGEFVEIPNQEELRQRHLERFYMRRHYLADNPEDAALHVPLDEEDEEYLSEIARKEQE